MGKKKGDPINCGHEMKLVVKRKEGAGGVILKISHLSTYPRTSFFSLPHHLLTFVYIFTNHNLALAAPKVATRSRPIGIRGSRGSKPGGASAFF